MIWEFYTYGLYFFRIIAAPTPWGLLDVSVYIISSKLSWFDTWKFCLNIEGKVDIFENVQSSVFMLKKGSQWEKRVLFNILTSTHYNKILMGNYFP